MANTRYVRLKNGKVDQVNDVVSITITSPTISDGTYRDTPPVVVGGAAAIAYDGTAPETVSVQIAGGVSPTVSNAASVGNTYLAQVIGASSVLQDDHYTHEPLRTKSGPEALLVITTDAGLATYDVLYKWKEVIGVSNCPPQGWVVQESR